MSDVLRQRQLDLPSDEGEVKHQEDKMASFGWKCVQISTSALSGVVFGFAVEKGRGTVCLFALSVCVSPGVLTVH